MIGSYGFGGWGIPAQMQAPPMAAIRGGVVVDGPSSARGGGYVLVDDPGDYHKGYSGCGCSGTKASFGDLGDLGTVSAFGAPVWSWVAGVVAAPVTGGLSLALPLAMTGARKDCQRLQHKYAKKPSRALKAKMQRACQKAENKAVRRAARRGGPGLAVLPPPGGPLLPAPGALPPGDFVVPGDPGGVLTDEVMEPGEAPSTNYLLWGGLAIAAVVGLAVLSGGGSRKAA